MAKILIVDDAVTVREDLKSILTKGGHTVVEAGDGDEGTFVLFKNLDVDLILSDVNMPNCDGFRMWEKIKKDARYTGSIVMLSTESTLELKLKAKELGITAWITKPSTADKILSAIQQILIKSP